MQVTIDDVTYNTALSHEIAHFSDGRQRGDPLHTFEVLYRTGSAWFLRRRRDGCESIVPLTPEQTRAWCEQKRFDWVLARWFGHPVKRVPRWVALL